VKVEMWLYFTYVMCKMQMIFSLVTALSDYYLLSLLGDSSPRKWEVG